MKSLRITFGLTIVALGFSNAADLHNVELKKSVTVGSTQLQPMQGQKAVFKSGKYVVEVPASLGKGDQKFDTTGIVTSGSKLVEIDLGGTSDKILFNAEGGQNAGGGK